MEISFSHSFAGRFASFSPSLHREFVCCVPSLYDDFSAAFVRCSHKSSVHVVAVCICEDFYKFFFTWCDFSERHATAASFFVSCTLTRHSSTSSFSAERRNHTWEALTKQSHSFFDAPPSAAARESYTAPSLRRCC